MSHLPSLGNATDPKPDPDSDLDSSIILMSQTLTISTWPHAVPDCPARWSCKEAAPCLHCHCFVCDVPLADCDDAASHIDADGSKRVWRLAKRRRRKLSGAEWDDIPSLVELIVELAVQEADVVAPVTVAVGRGESPTFVGEVGMFEMRGGAGGFGKKSEKGEVGELPAELPVVQLGGGFGVVKKEEGLGV